MKRSLILIAVIGIALTCCTKDPEQPEGRSNQLIVTTAPVTMITRTGARCGGTASTGGADSITARGACWGTVTNPTIVNSKTTDGSGSGTYTSVITGLLSNRQYYVRAYVMSAAGVVYGGVRTFRTL